MKKAMATLTFLFGWCALACSVHAQGSSSIGTRVQASSLPVHPASISQAPVFELTCFLDAVISATSNGDVTWSSDLPGVAWQHSNVVEQRVDEALIYSRSGYARVRLAGRASTITQSKTFELAWIASYVSKGDRSRPQLLRIAPGLISEPCFGRQYSGCSFKFPSRDLQRLGLEVRQLCKGKPYGEDVEAYGVRRPGQRESVVRWWQSAGSGGVTSELEVLFGGPEASQPCAGEAEVSASSTLPSTRGSVDADAETFQMLVAKTDACMYESAQAMTMMGARETDTIINFQIQACGGFLVNQMVSLGQSERVATEFIRAMAYKNLQLLQRGYR